MTYEERVAVPQPEPRGWSETILLVEDQEPLRRLRDYGYTVYTAGDGEEGIIEAGRQMGEIDLIITDVVMPNVGGQELYEVVRGQSQPPKILFMSGYSSRDLRQGALLDRRYPLLQKPWTLPELVRRVREILDEPAVTTHQPQSKAVLGA